MSKPTVNDMSEIAQRRVQRIAPGPRPRIHRTGTVVIESDARTPHQAQWVGICLEIAMQREKSPLKKYFWTTMANRIKDAQQFQFGEIDDRKIQVEAKRAGPLFSDGHLNLPYQSVIYNYTLMPDPKIVSPEMAMERVKFSTLACIVDKKMVKDPLPGPLIMAVDFIFADPHEFEGKKKFCMIMTGAVAFQSSAPEYKWKGEIIDDSMIPQRSSLVSVADGVGSLSMMLATRGIKCKRKEPSQKLQKARVKRGHSLLPIVTHVNTQKYYEAMENVEKGHHASPVPHLRRGHRRRLGEGRETWVRDCIVNCCSLDEASKARDHYEVE